MLLLVYCLVDVFVVSEGRRFSSTMLNLTLCCLLCFDGGVWNVLGYFLIRNELLLHLFNGWSFFDFFTVLASNIFILSSCLSMMFIISSNFLLSLLSKGIDWFCEISINKFVCSVMNSSWLV